MELRLEELLSCKFLSESKLLTADKNGYDAVAKSVAIMDTPNGHHYLKGNEMVLTSGYFLAHDTERQKTIIKDLKEKNVACLAMKLYFFDGKLPPILEEEANRYKFPIINLPNYAVYTEIANFIESNLMTKETKEIKNISQIQEEISDSFMSHGFQGMAESVYKWTGLKTIITINDDYYASPYQEEAFPFQVGLWKKKPLQAGYYTSAQAYYINKDNRHIEWFASEIQVNSDVLGHIILIKDSRVPLREIFQILDYCILLTKIEMRANIKILEIKRKHKRNYLRKFLLKKTSLEKMRNQSLGLNYYLCPEGHVVLIKGEFRVETLERVVGKYCVKGTLSGLIEDELAMIYIENTKYFEETVQKIFDEIAAQYKENTIIMGIGDDYDIESVNQSYEEALCALNVGSVLKDRECNIYKFKDLGFYRFFKKYNVEKGLDRELLWYYNRCLKPLRESKEEGFESMIKTIDVYIKNNYNYRETANALYMHSNTVRYRVALVEKICSMDFKNAEDRLNMAIALKILPFVEEL